MTLSRSSLRNTVLGFLLIAALLAGCNYPVEVEAPIESGEAGIAGRVWHDRCAAPPPGEPLPETAPQGCVLSDDGSAYIANGRLDQNEAGVSGVEVRLGEGSCPSFGLQISRTEPDGLYLFAGLSPGTYCVSIDPSNEVNSGILMPGFWTYPGIEQVGDIVSSQADLAEDEIRADVYFAWDYQLLPPYESASTPLPPTETTAALEPTPTTTATSEGTPTITTTPTPEISPTPTLGAEDPRSNLKNPTWVDEFENSSDWALYSDTHVSFEIVPGGLEMTAFNPDFFNSWVLSWRKAQDLYLETRGTFGQCAGRDAYGLMIRSTGGSSGYIGYLFGISCDGRYSLRSWDGESMATIVGWTPDESINAGPDATNRMGIWAVGNRLSLYANGEFLIQVDDVRHQDEGLFGLFISSAQTSNFTGLIEEIAFWNLD